MSLINLFKCKDKIQEKLNTMTTADIKGVIFEV
jgi:hypothetical protein